MLFILHRNQITPIVPATCLEMIIVSPIHLSIFQRDDSLIQGMRRFKCTHPPGILLSRTTPSSMASSLDISASPEIKSLVCEPCWRNVFTFQGFKDLLASTKLTYTTTAESIASSTTKGCSWCTFLADNAKNGQGDVKVSLWIKPEERAVTPTGAKRLHVSICGVQTSTYSSYTLYTTIGIVKLPWCL